MKNFDARDTDLASWPRDRLNAETLAAQKYGTDLDDWMLDNYNPSEVGGVTPAPHHKAPDPNSYKDSINSPKLIKYDRRWDADLLHASVCDWETHAATQARLRRVVMAYIAGLLLAFCVALWWWLE